MGQKDTGIKIPVLKKEYYFHWKVEMHVHLLSLDFAYVKCLDLGTHVPMNVQTGRWYR